MRILVTGGLGYVGSVYVALAAQAGQHCIVVDHNASKKNLLRELPNVTVIIADLLQQEQVKAIFVQHQPQVVHHFAAHSAVGIVPDEVFAENVIATENLLAAMQACQPRPSLVFSSSCSVYGNCDGVVDESAALQPVSAYARSKADCERLLNTAAVEAQLAITALRYSNVAGVMAGFAAQRVRENQLIPKLSLAALHNEAVTIFGNDFPTPDGTCQRDYVHVHDVVTAHQQAVAQVQAGHCGSYNICAGVSHSNLEVVRAVEQASNKRLQLNLAARRKGDPAAVQLSYAKAKRELGYVPQYSSLATIVADTYRWLQQHN